MIKISELKFLENILFRNTFNYEKTSFYSFFVQNFSESKLFDTESLEKIEKLLQDTKESPLAHNLLLHKDLSTIRKRASKKNLQFDSTFWLEQLPEINALISKHLNLSFNPRPIYFCDSFPKGHEGYDPRGASAITIFEGQKNAGIYFLNKRVDQTSTSLHIIHEQVHTCLSQNKDKKQIFIEWFEEGIAILYSLKIYYDLTKDLKTLHAYKERSFLFSKVKPEWDFSKRYFEYMKIMSRLFLAGGFELLSDLISRYLNNERDYINSFLEKIQQNSLSIKYLPKNDFENFLATFFNIIEPEQITPLEFVIVDILKTPKTIVEISEQINAPEDITKNALQRLFGKGICIAVKDNKIDLIWRKKDLFDQNLIKPIYMLK